MTDTYEPAVGDWIRFMRGGILVIDLVVFIRPRATWDSTLEIVTFGGRVQIEDVLEVRRSRDVHV